jgi:hypothetical protein
MNCFLKIWTQGMACLIDYNCNWQKAPTIQHAQSSPLCLLGKLERGVKQLSTSRRIFADTQSEEKNLNGWLIIIVVCQGVLMFHFIHTIRDTSAAVRIQSSIRGKQGRQHVAQKKEAIAEGKRHAEEAYRKEQEELRRQAEKKRAEEFARAEARRIQAEEYTRKQKEQSELKRRKRKEKTAVCIQLA